MRVMSASVGMSGEDANLFTASRRGAVVDGELVDIGQVGEIDRAIRHAVDEVGRHDRARRAGPGCIGGCDDDYEFAFGLDLILDGLERRRIS